MAITIIQSLDDLQYYNLSKKKKKVWKKNKRKRDWQKTHKSVVKKKKKYNKRGKNLIIVDEFWNLWSYRGCEFETKCNALC